VVCIQHAAACLLAGHQMHFYLCYFIIPVRKAITTVLNSFACRVCASVVVSSCFRVLAFSDLPSKDSQLPVWRRRPVVFPQLSSCFCYVLLVKAVPSFDVLSTVANSKTINRLQESA